MYCCRILRAGKLPGCAEPWEEAPSMLGSQADLQYKQLETDDPAPRFPRPLSIFFFLSVGTFTSPRVRVAESGRGRDAHVVGPPPSTSSPTSGEPIPGFPACLPTTCETSTCRLSPSCLPAPRSSPPACKTQCSTPPLPLRPRDPSPAPPPRPGRFVPGGGGGGGPGAALSARRGDLGWEAGRLRNRPITAAITSMQIRAQWSEPITRSCKQA